MLCSTEFFLSRRLLINAYSSGIQMTGVSKASLLIFVVLPRFLQLTAEFWQVNDHRKRQGLPMNQSKTTLFGSRNLKGLVLSPELMLNLRPIFAFQCPLACSVGGWWAWEQHPGREEVGESEGSQGTGDQPCQ